MKANITNCERCGEDHNNVDLVKLNNPLRIQGAEKINYFALCPTNGEPMLFEGIDSKIKLNVTLE